jgi:hypothetical protein
MRPRRQRIAVIASVPAQATVINDLVALAEKILR